MRSATVIKKETTAARAQRQGERAGRSAPSALKFGTILVPIDYSESSRFAYEYALSLAEKFESRVCLLHILENRTSPDFESFPLSASRTATRDRARRELVAFARAGSHPLVPVFPEIRSGVPWQEIVDAARKEKADLIVIPTHGRTGLKHVMMGSVAERVVRHSHCPVLVLRNQTVDLLITKDSPRIKEKHP